MARHHARHSRKKTAGKKIVYITPYRSLAVEVARMYEKKGEAVGIEPETDRGGATLFLVYILGRGI